MPLLTAYLASSALGSPKTFEYVTSLIISLRFSSVICSDAVSLGIISLDASLFAIVWKPIRLWQMGVKIVND